MHASFWHIHMQRWQCQLCLFSSTSLKGECTGAPAQGKGHKLFTLLDVTFCGSCGAYTAGRVKYLAEVCLGRAGTTANMKVARDRLLQGRHPITKLFLGHPLPLGARPLPNAVTLISEDPDIHLDFVEESPEVQGAFYEDIPTTLQSAYDRAFVSHNLSEEGEGDHVACNSLYEDPECMSSQQAVDVYLKGDPSGALQHGGVASSSSSGQVVLDGALPSHGPYPSLTDNMSSHQADTSYMGEGGAESSTNAYAINAVLEAVHDPEIDSRSLSTTSGFVSYAVCEGADEDSGSD